jgi:hypothetical protein
MVSTIGHSVCLTGHWVWTGVLEQTVGWAGQVVCAVGHWVSTRGQFV